MPKEIMNDEEFTDDERLNELNCCLRLSEEAFERFYDHCLNPPEPSAYLRRIITATPPWK